MDFYWIYTLPNWVLGVLILGAFTAIGVAGLYGTRGTVRRLHGAGQSQNDVVSYFLSAVTVFYGITLGLVAVGTWQTYSDAQNRVDHEAVALGGLYRNISAYPEPIRSVLESDLRLYTRQVIDVGWPMQQQGIVPNNASGVLAAFQRDFMSFEPVTERQKIVAMEAYRSFDDLTESRRARLNSVTAEMPGPLWVLVIAGAVLSIGATWFFHTARFGMHLALTVLFSVLIGLLIYLVASLDNPYRGRISVTPEPLELVYQQMMAAQP